jgi:hypothetical protein
VAAPQLARNPAERVARVGLAGHAPQQLIGPFQ